MKKQMDEMERNIKRQSESLGFKVTIFIMALWTLYESYRALSTGLRLNILPCLVVTAGCTVTGIYELLLKRRMIEGDEEYKEPNKALLVTVGIVALAAVICTLGAYFVLKLN